MPKLVHPEPAILVQWVKSTVGGHTTPNFDPSTVTLPSFIFDSNGSDFHLLLALYFCEAL